MKRYRVFFYWLLLMVATLTIGGVTFYLLQRESDRLRTAAKDNAVRTGQAIASQLNSIVKQVKTDSMNELGKFSETGIETQILGGTDILKDTFPYVRNAFYFIPGQGLEFPKPNTPERDFLQPLLRNRFGYVWDQTNRVLQQYMMANFQGTLRTGNSGSINGAPPPINSSLPSDGVTGPGAPPDVFTSEVQGSVAKVVGSGPGQTQVISSQQTLTIVSATNPLTEPIRSNEGWVPVYRNKEFYWLGWMRAAPTAPVRGLLLSWEAIQNAMDKAFPDKLNAAEGFILRNPEGKAIKTRFADGAMLVGNYGNDPVEEPGVVPAVKAAKVLPFEAETQMPGWSLEVYFNPDAKFPNNFMALSTVLVTVLVISVLVGGTLLMREARREASDAARKTSFVSNVSHELKTPLTTIRMYAELLGEGRVRDPAKQRNYLSTIINESQRLTRLVNNVLDFSRLEQGRKNYNRDNVALAEVVRAVLDAQRPRLEEAGFQVDTELATAGDLRVLTDRDALEQVLLNLMDNALKYAADGHWLGVKISANDNHAILTVSDRGPGVPADQREKIFEMFHRVDDSITARLPGAGLGLSIARRLLRDQEGDLQYQPNPTGGASFVAMLPLAQAVENAPPPPAEASLATR